MTPRRLKSRLLRRMRRKWARDIKVVEVTCPHCGVTFTTDPFHVKSCESMVITYVASRAEGAR